jgi:hypothetical protein
MFMQTSMYLGEKAMFTMRVAMDGEEPETSVSFGLLKPADFTPPSPEEGPIECTGPR